MTATPAKRPSLPRLLLSVSGIGMLLGIVGGMVVAFDLAPTAAVFAMVALAAGMGAMWQSWRWWVKVDEAVREAHKASWFWGGSFGLVAVGAVATPLVAISAGLAPAVSGLTRSEAGFMLAGVVTTVFLLLLGYVVCWAGWWLSRGR